MNLSICYKYSQMLISHLKANPTWETKNLSHHKSIKEKVMILDLLIEY